jgi:hypothetical protein
LENYGDYDLSGSLVNSRNVELLFARRRAYGAAGHRSNSGFNSQAQGHPDDAEKASIQGVSPNGFPSERVVQSARSIQPAF